MYKKIVVIQLGDQEGNLLFIKDSLGNPRIYWLFSKPTAGKSESFDTNKGFTHAYGPYFGIFGVPRGRKSGKS